MREHEVAIASAVRLAAVLCLPEDAHEGARVPALLLIGGSGADTRDGDLARLRLAVTPSAPAPGTLRRIAHRLAGEGVASLRWDRRGFGGSAGVAEASDYDTDLEDAIVCLDWLRARPAVDPTRVGVAGHSAGALTACHACRDAGEVAAAGLLGALASPIEEMLRWNLGRIARHWDDFTEQQRGWLTREMPGQVVLGLGVEKFIDAAVRGDDLVLLESGGARLELRTRRLRQDLATSYADEFRHVRCPALVLHGGADLNVPVGDALVAYRALRLAGNDDVQLTVLPGLDHYFHPVAADPAERVWERISGAGLRRPMALGALDAIGSWAGRALGARL